VLLRSPLKILRWSSPWQRRRARRNRGLAPLSALSSHKYAAALSADFDWSQLSGAQGQGGADSTGLGESSRHGAPACMVRSSKTAVLR